MISATHLNNKECPFWINNRSRVRDRERPVCRKARHPGKKVLPDGCGNVTIIDGQIAASNGKCRRNRAGARAAGQDQEISIQDKGDQEYVK